MRFMNVFTKSEQNFLNSLGDNIFAESSKSDRVKALEKTIQLLESMGYKPKISKRSKVGWINENNSGDFEESLCISLGQLQGLPKVCTEVNSVIKPLNAKVSPDNYGTIFLSMIEKDDVVTESYIGNYFKNKILLHKLGSSPELNERMIIKFVKNLNLKYESSLLDDEVKEIMNKKDVSDWYIPEASLKFKDGMEITFAFNYDKKSFTPGAAFKSEDKGYVVVLYPVFFTNPDIEVQVFTIMHEIGHIRLGHCEIKNTSLDPERRQKVMVKGGAIYTELNADLYAALNGAKMYTILKEAIDTDYDKKYDYRYTNNEMAKRYSYVLKNFRKLRPMNESVEDIFEESVFKEENDIFYNKWKYENGDINLLFITGYSGGGKSTMSRSEDKFAREVVDMDRIVLFTNKSDEYYENLGPFAKKFMDGPGKKYRTEKNVSMRNSSGVFRKKISIDLVDFAKSYAKENKRKKVVMEGVWIYRYIEPSDIEDYAVYIKGTSLKTSTERAIKRDKKYMSDNHDGSIKKGFHSFTKVVMASKDAILRDLEKYQNYFKDKYESQKDDHKDYVKSAKNTVKNVVHDIVGTVKNIKESVDDTHDNWYYFKESEISNRTAKTGEFEIEEEYFKVYHDKDYAYVKVKGIDKPLRGRSEILIMKDNEVYLCCDNNRYRLPGGGWDKGESYEHAALREAKEEAKINCTNIRYVTSRVDTQNSVPEKCKKENIPEEGYWYGYFTKVFIGEYDKKFNGHIDKEDQDQNMVKHGKFYPIDEIKDKLYPEHKEAIESYLGASISESGKEDPKQEILDHLKHYVKWCRMDDGLFLNIEPLPKYIIHNSKKNGQWLLLATLRHMDKKRSDHLLECLHNNIGFDGEHVDFHTCYLPGDVFVYINLPDTVKESVEDIYEETVDDEPFDLEYFFLEDAKEPSHFIRDGLGPYVEATLSTREGDKLFKRYVEEFVDRNTEKLHEPCPISMIAFTDHDKTKFFDLFKISEKEVAKIISKAVSAVSDTASFKLVKQNPILSLFYMVLRYYYMYKDEAGINSTLVIHALAAYPSVFSKYFKYGANPGVMKYTADHLTEKFIFKQEGHVFGALRKSIEASYKFLNPYFKDAEDKEIIRYIQRIRNDQNSLIKKIANEYNKNFKAGKSVSTTSETYDTGALIDEADNDTSKVEILSQKIIINILTNGIDLRILETAAAMAQLSITELRLYLVKILIDSKSTELEDFINAVLFIYLFEEKHNSSEIKSRAFLSFAIELFRKTNSNNKNIVTIKTLLDKWAEETGINSKYRREPTRISYKKGIYWYILLCIQTNM